MKYLFILFSLLFVTNACTTNDPNDSISPNASTAQFNLLWEIPVPSFLPQGIVLDEQGRNYFYVASKSGGVQIFDDSQSPAELISDVSIDNFGNHHAMHLTQQGDYLYVALGDFFGGNAKAGIAIIDVSDPNNPTTTDFWETSVIEEGSAIVIVKDNYAYLGAMSKGIYVFDISNKSNIVQTDQFIPDIDFPVPNPNSIQEPNARGMTIRGNDLFVSYDAGGIRVIDVTDKSNLEEKSRYINESFDKQHAYNNIILNGDYAYTATDYCGMEILDISDINNITLASWCNPWECDTPQNIWLNSAGHANQLVYDALNNRVILSTGGSEITLIDVSNPNDCQFISSYGTRSNNLATWGLTMKDNKVYATYITSVIPFPGTWRGIKCIEIN
ncbi:hypothetical protein [Dokdonia sp.]|uniref:LVIVD repeat-containing protein n=1 Tax=Dokdonia sp. TaxID=2024995 RepID=UPI0032655D13